MPAHALVMGFGGSGSYILTAIKKIAVVKHGGKPDGLQFLEFDTLASGLTGEDLIFKPSKYLEGDEENNEQFLLDEYEEYHHLSDEEPYFYSHIERNVFHPVEEGYDHFENWLHAKWMSENLSQNLRNIATGAGQHRQIGRYAMFRNAEGIRERIEGKLEEASRGNTLVPVWLVGSAAGGTGAGTMIDAAFITRKAARDADANIEVAGVVVLPSVYEDIAGIDEARVHSFFRELERFQTATSDKFQHDGRQIASFVEYPNFRSDVSNQLFDNLIYVGEQCTDDAERREFFTSVGNAIEPYLDGMSGPNLLKATANKNGVFSSFGAARLQVPQETLAERFAHEQMRDYLDAVVPQTDESGVEAGPPGQRRAAAAGRIQALLNFGVLLNREGWSDDRHEQFVGNLSPADIVTGWYQFNNIASREDQRVARNAYADPLYSLTEPDRDKVDKAEIRLKTYNELRNSGGSETQEMSRDRFYDRLKDYRQKYTSEYGGTETFQKGRERIHEVVTDHLIDQVDSDITDALSGPVTDADGPGTRLTRLCEELKHIIARGGLLDTINGVLDKMIEVAESEESSAEEAFHEECELLNREAASGLFGSWSTWVEAPQKDARDAAADYFDAYQKHQLLRDLREMVQEVRDRYEAWYEQVKSVIDALALGDNPVRHDIKDEITALDGRLKKMSEQGTAMFSLKAGDTTMQGYQDVLRSEATTSGDGAELSDNALGSSQWKASVEDGRPVLTLAMRDNKVVDSTNSPKMSRDFRREVRYMLHEEFRDTIDTRLGKRDVFDYLLYLVNKRGSGPGKIATRLRAKSTPLHTGGGPINYLCLHASPGAPGKAKLARSIRTQFGQNATHLSHGDENALTLVQVKKPQAGDAIPELGAYKKSYTDLIDAGEEAGERFERALVNHPFRSELEAWFVEHHFSSQHGVDAAKCYLPPRIVRLLKYPRMMQVFVQCLASGAVEKTEVERGHKAWVWYNTERDLECELTDPRVPGHDLIQAATTFVLRQKPLTYAIGIGNEAARRSAYEKAEDGEETAQEGGAENGDVRPLKKRVEDFTEEETVRTFIDKHATTASQEEREGLARVFQFYGRWGVEHGLHQRHL